MIIIVEGPDGSGKSTLIKQLLVQYPGAVVKHFGAPVPGEDQYTRYMLPIVSNPGKIIIYDRSWYSEFVYGPVIRNTHELSVNQCRALEAAIMRHGGGHIIYLTADIDTLWDRCTDRGETYITSKQMLLEISAKYETVMKELPILPVLRVDTGR